jgi:RNA-directed DNA polymerase
MQPHRKAPQYFPSRRVFLVRKVREYGFRPGRSPHQALDALTVGIQRKKVNWVLDADIRGFFDNMSHEWTMKFIEHRVADRRMLRLIQKWLKAGVSEDGQWSEMRLGTPQGAVVSPLIANVYLHYVFDLWAEVWRRKVAKGDVIVVRYADDLVLAFSTGPMPNGSLESLRTGSQSSAWNHIRTRHG